MTDLRKRNDELLAALEAAHTREAIAERQRDELQQDFDAIKTELAQCDSLCSAVIDERDALRCALAEALEVVRFYADKGKYAVRMMSIATFEPEIMDDHGTQARAFLAKHGGTRLDKLLKQSAAAYDAMSPEEKAAHDEAQRQSWIRSIAPCEHGVRDWESCPDCIAKHGGTDAE